MRFFFLQSWHPLELTLQCGHRQGPKTEKGQLSYLMECAALRKLVVVQLTNYTKQGQPFLNTLRVELMTVGDQQFFLATSEMALLADVLHVLTRVVEI